MGINAYNVYRNLIIITTIGADREHLRKSTAFEMFPVGDKRSEQIAFAEHLVNHAGGLLAPPTGKEKYLTVASSHFSAGCRAVAAGCTTSEADLRDQSGFLNIIQVCAKDPILKSIIQDGWEFMCIPWMAEHIWPQLPDLAQAALNAEHSTYSMATELQSMAMIAINANNSEDEKTWEDAISATKGAMPPCHEYLHTLGEFVRCYGGGAGAPMVRCQ